MSLVSRSFAARAGPPTLPQNEPSGTAPAGAATSSPVASATRNRFGRGQGGGPHPPPPGPSRDGTRRAELAGSPRDPAFISTSIWTTFSGFTVIWGREVGRPVGRVELGHHRPFRRRQRRHLRVVARVARDRRDARRGTPRR